MPAAKQHHKAPLVIAQDVVDRLQDGSVFASAEAVKPGFINLRVQPAYLAPIWSRCARASASA